MADRLDALFPDLDVDELLFHGVVEGSLQDYEGLLEELEDVDVRGVGQRTLLHVAVKLGRLEWVGALLNMGADPGLRDRDGSTVTEVSRKMNEKYPGDEMRRKILALLTLVHGRDDGVWCRFNRLGRESSSGQSDSDQENQNVGTVLDGVLSTRSPVLRDVTQFDSQMSKHVVCASLHPAANNQSGDVFVRDAIRTISEDIANLRQRLVTLMEDDDYHVNTVISLIIRIVAENVEEISRLSCIQAMAQKSEIREPSEGLFYLLRCYYEEMYSFGPLTSSILKYLQHDSRVKISFHREPDKVIDMSHRVEHGSGVALMYFEGNVCVAFVDYDCMRVHLGGDVFCGHREVLTLLSMSLTQMAVHIMFGNRGRPYEESDPVGREKFQGVVREGEEKLRAKRPLDDALAWALTNRSQRVKEAELTASVPRMAACFGSTEAESLLRQQLPSLFDYYERHVMAKLLNP